MKNIKKLIATLLTAATVFVAFTGTLYAAEDGRPQGTERVGEWKEVWDLSINMPYYVMIGDANLDYKIDQTDATLIRRYVEAARNTPRWMPIYLWGRNPIVPQYKWPSWYMPHEMDVDRDGYITDADADLLLQYLLWQSMNR